MRIIVYILTIMLLFSCRTPSKVEERTNITEQRQSTDWSAYEDGFQTSIDKAVKESVEEMKKRISELNLEYNRTKYSPPDSTGRQYPTQVETGKLNNKAEESSQRNQQTEEQYKVVSASLTRIFQRVDSIEQRYVQTELEYKEKLSWYQSALIFLGCLFYVYIIMTVYIKLKKP